MALACEKATVKPIALYAGLEKNEYQWHQAWPVSCVRLGSPSWSVHDDVQKRQEESCLLTFANAFIFALVLHIKDRCGGMWHGLISSNAREGRPDDLSFLTAPALPTDLRHRLPEEG